MSPGTEDHNCRIHVANGHSEHPKSPKDAVSSRGEPEGCLFVASLEKTKPDAELTTSVMRHFQQYGRLLHVKVLKDPQGRPYSFVQFERVEDAKRAKVQAHDTIVDGRRIRVEPARVNRTLYVTNRSGEDLLTEEELREKVEGPYGYVENIYFQDNMQDGVLTHSEGIAAYVKFRYRDDAVNAYLGLRQLQRYHVEWSANVEYDGETGRARPGRSSAAAPLPTAPGEGDRCAIFVGQLNAQRVNQRVLEERFRAYGSISNCDFHNRGSGPNRAAFAFIRFTDEGAAQRAIARENGQQWFDRPIRVQQRCGGPPRPSRARNGFASFSVQEHMIGTPPPHYIAGNFPVIRRSVPQVTVHQSGMQRGWPLPPTEFYAPRTETSVRFAPYYPLADQGWPYEGQIYYSYPYQPFPQCPYDPAVPFDFVPYPGVSFHEYTTYASADPWAPQAEPSSGEHHESAAPSAPDEAVNALPYDGGHAPKIPPSRKPVRHPPPPPRIRQFQKPAFRASSCPAPDEQNHANNTNHR